MEHKEEGKSKHWMTWDKMCYPQAEESVGLRDLFDIYKAMFAKLWWIFRTTRSLWTDFMLKMYFKKLIPTVVQRKGGSQIWKKMLEARDVIEQEIWWSQRWIHLI